MSRSGYVDDCDNLNLYRANVCRSIGSKRGQAFLKELAAAMDAMPEKVLVAGELIDDGGNCCTIGVVCKARSLDVSKTDPHDTEAVGGLVGINHILAAEIEYENDECGTRWEDKGLGKWDRVEETPAERWQRMRNWVEKQIKN